MGSEVERAIAAAQSKRGCPYVWATAGPNTFDCSGFTWWVGTRVFGSLNEELRSSHHQFNVWGVPIDRERLRAGDLAFFNTMNVRVMGNLASHVALMLDGHRFIHAANEALGVRVDDLRPGGWYAPRFIGARRIFDLGESEESDRPAKPLTSLSEVAARVDTPNQWNGSPFAVTWPDVGRWTEEINAAAKAARVDARVLAAIVMMETQGIHERDGRVLAVDDGYGDGPAVGLTQVKPRLWGWLCPACDPYSPAGNLLLAAKVLAYFREEEGDELDRIMRRWFPAPDPNGTTPHRYMATFRGLMGEQGYAA